MVLPGDDVGSGPAVVLLHAGVADRTMWREHLRPIADAGYRALAFDLPGFGEAEPAAESAPWVDVLETLDSFAVDRAALVGNSFGGAVALRVAVCAPERVSALMVVSAPPIELEPSAELGAAWEAEEEALERGDVDGAVAAVIDAWTLPDASPALRDRVGTMQRRAFERQLAADAPVEAEDPVEQQRSALATLTIPTLVARGEFEMPDFHTGAQELAAELPAAREVVITGAGHLAPLEQPDAFRALLLDLLAG
jgi:pimeloyl-ACP methyl ester carboxylesterase